MISQAVRNLLELLKSSQFESCVPFMYMDSEGNVTVGVGHNLSAHYDAQNLKFVVKRFERQAVKGGDQGIPIALDARKVDRAATPEEIKNDFDFLASHPGLSKYADMTKMGKYTTVELTEAAINVAFSKDLDDAEALCKSAFKGIFDGFPDGCKAALIDIAFNTGHIPDFGKVFLSAIKGTGTFTSKTAAERWKAAAAAAEAATTQAGQISSVRIGQRTQWFLDGAASLK